MEMYYSRASGRILKHPMVMASDVTLTDNDHQFAYSRYLYFRLCHIETSFVRSVEKCDTREDKKIQTTLILGNSEH